MKHIQAGQIKAARAILDWSQEELAQSTGLSITTIRNLEMGHVSPRGSTYDVIRKAVEGAGVEFIEQDGVRRRTDEVRVLRGLDGRATLIADIQQTARQGGGDVCFMMKNQSMLFDICGEANAFDGDVDGFFGLTGLRCLLFDEKGPVYPHPPFQFRAISKQYAWMPPSLTYGNKHVLVLKEGSASYRFIVVQSSELAQSFQNAFWPLWEMAMPLMAPVERRMRVGARS